MKELYDKFSYTYGKNRPSTFNLNQIESVWIYNFHPDVLSCSRDIHFLKHPV